MGRQTVRARTVGEVDKLTKPGLWRVGGVSGLCLRVKASGARSWMLRATFGGKRIDIGLGSYPSVTLSSARERARLKLDLMWMGNDPTERPNGRGSAGGQSVTFADCLAGYLDDKMAGMKNAARQRMALENAMRRHVPALLGRPVADIGTDDILTALKPLWKNGKADIGARLRARIEGVLAWATVHAHRTGDNPARWRGHLKEALASPSRVHTLRHFPACQLDDFPGFMVALRGREASSSRLALEFLILTAARSNEVRMAQWSEIDMQKAVWTIPASRMKSGREHRVPLSEAAMDVLNSAPHFAGCDLIFPGAGGNRPMSDMTLNALIKKMHDGEVRAGRRGWLDGDRRIVAHGFRSTFRVWAAERTTHPGEMAELALAHTVGDAVERSYQRSDMFEKRRAMMDAWAAFAAGGGPAA